MKLKSNRFLAFAFLATAFATLSASAAIWVWDGGAATGDWQTNANWNPDADNNDFNGTFANRLTVVGAQALIYSSAEGNTTYTGGNNFGVVIGSGAAGSGTTGTMIITGGTFSTLDSNGDVIGNGSTNSGTLTINGGNFIGSKTAGGNGYTNMGIGAGPTSTLNVQNGTATLVILKFNNTTGNVNLDGGTLALNTINRTAGTNTINFNGGTLKARITNPTFLADLAGTTVNVKSGGAVIDTSGDLGTGVDVTIAEPLLEDPLSTGGGLTKNGAGLLTLSTLPTTTGPTIINAGGLALKGGAASWAPSAFTHSGATLNLDLGNVSLLSTPVIDTGVLTINSAVTVKVSGSNFVTGTIPLINYTSKSITGSLTLDTSSLPVGVDATLVDDNAGSIYLDVSVPVTYVWSGDSNPGANGDWDTTSQNWNNNTATYSNAGDQIAQFPDIAGGGTVTITGAGAFSPLSVSISNAAGNPYTFNGTGKITGATAVEKSNTGIVTFASGTNDYSGVTNISGGALIKQAADSTSGGISVSNGATFVLSGGVTDGAGQTITLTGPGNTAANYFYTGSAVQRGALQAQTGSNTWAGDIVVTDSGNSRIGVQDGASLTLTGTISGVNPRFRAGDTAGSDIVFNGTATWTGITTLFSKGGASLRIDGDNKLSTAAVAYFSATGATIFDLNGHNQEFPGFSSDASSIVESTITNNAPSTTSTLTSNTPAATSFLYKTGIADGASGTGKVSLIKTGDGTQILSAANTYTGTTTVNAGILRINGDQSGATGDVQVNGGALGGIGTIGGAVTVGALGTINPADVTPGGATGTLTVESANLSAAGTLAIDMNDANAQKADLLSVNDSLDVSNAKLVINVTGALAEPSYQLATATTITGTISPGNVTGLPSGYTLVQTATEIRLDQATASAYVTWGTPYGLTAGSEGGDLDNDGLTNFEEFAFGLIPNSGSSANPITVQLNKTNGQFTYQRLAASGLTYTVWTSTDLVTWSPAAIDSQTPTTVGDNESVEVTLSGAPLSAAKLFVRVKAQ